MVAVGVHVSIAGSIDRAVDRAQKLGCDTFQIFTRIITKIERSGIYPPVAHAPYLPNLASPKEEVYSRSVDALASEIARCSVLKIPYLVTHLGSHLGTGTEGGVMRIISAVWRDAHNIGCEYGDRCVRRGAPGGGRFCDAFA
jgi:deoxyribonuclease-4